MIKKLFVAPMIILSAFANAKEHEFQVGELYIGMPQEMYIKSPERFFSIPHLTVCKTKKNMEEICSGAASSLVVAGRRVDFLVLAFKSKKLVSADLRFDSIRFYSIKDEIEEKYGKLDCTDTSGKFSKNETCTKETKNLILKLMKYSINEYTTSFFISDKKHFDTVEKKGEVLYLERF